MTGLTLLVLLGYIPYVFVGLVTRPEVVHRYVRDVTRWPVLHQSLCLIGGFLWLPATVSYARHSGHACGHCGRRVSVRRSAS